MRRIVTRVILAPLCIVVALTIGGLIGDALRLQRYHVDTTDWTAINRRYLEEDARVLDAFIRHHACPARSR